MTGILVHGDNHFIVRGPEPSLETARDLARHWTLIQIGARTPAHLRSWTIVNREFRASIVLCRHQTTMRGASRWVIRLDESLQPDITVAVRMDEANEGIQDYYILPSIDMTWENLRIAEDNGIYLDAYRFQTLDYFFHMSARTTIQQQAV